MTKRDESRPIEHPSALFLEYLEDRLPQEDRTMIEHHIDTCDECSSELLGLTRMIRRVKMNKDAFCPEPEELFEFVRKGEDPNGVLRSHLDSCSLCSDEVAQYREAFIDKPLPEKVRTAVERRFGKPIPAAPEAETHGLFAWLSEWVGSALRAPAIAIAATAAAILVAVIIYPRGGLETVVGLSSVTWEQAPGVARPKGELAADQNPRVAVLLAFKRFRDPLPQDRIDALYEALTPTKELMERYDILTPAVVRYAVTENKVKPDNAQTMLEMVAKELDLARALVVTISPKEDKFLIETDLLELPQGRVIKRETIEALGWDKLSDRLKDSLALFP